ncbi:MAG: sugar-binding domain-containing protein [Hoeflea sp.]|nr:sugar-binding domain-containing protein [Hoeflea sp.]
MHIAPAKPVIAIAVGIPKAEAILAAMRGRLINGLVTDEATAEHLLNH